ncbi:zinc-ribbon domain-containing protein [Thauera humireducens]|uniref:zinc-ribbon domain-containing protein n=1 Tax=Thauera humireducens TaxID=1134435 RepID=UPI003C788AFB
MALANCRDCGAQISTTAKSCPRCGAKPRSALGALATIGKAVVHVGFAVVLIVTFIIVFRVVSSYQ